jgi:hypothetical protein
MDEKYLGLVVLDFPDDTGNQGKRRKHVTRARLPRKHECINTLGGRSSRRVPNVKARQLRIFFRREPVNERMKRAHLT